MLSGIIFRCFVSESASLYISILEHSTFLFLLRTHDYYMCTLLYRNDTLLHLSSYNFICRDFMQRFVMLCELYPSFWMHPSTFGSEAVPESNDS